MMKRERASMMPYCVRPGVFDDRNAVVVRGCCVVIVLGVNGKRFWFFERNTNSRSNIPVGQEDGFKASSLREGSTPTLKETNVIDDVSFPLGINRENSMFSLVPKQHKNIFCISSSVMFGLKPDKYSQNLLGLVGGIIEGTDRSLKSSCFVPQSEVICFSTENSSRRRLALNRGHTGAAEVSGVRKRSVGWLVPCPVINLFTLVCSVSATADN